MESFEEKGELAQPSSKPVKKDDVIVGDIQGILSEADKRVESFLTEDQGKKKKPPILYDPQGRILFRVGTDYEVSYDVAKHSQLKDGYNVWVKKALNREINKQSKPTTDDTSSLLNIDVDALVARLNQLPSKSSIISLQQELHQHLALAARLYEETIINGLRDKNVIKERRRQIKDAHSEAMQKINRFVSQAFAAALLEARNIPENNPEAFIETINQILDKKCEEFVPKAHDILLNQIQKQTNNALQEAHFLPEIRAVRKKTAEETTATGRHLLHIDQAGKTVTRIEGSKMTSHNRIEGKEFANRSIRTYVMGEDGSLQPKDRVWVRTPSLPLKKGLKEARYIADTCDKLEHIATHYALSEPFTYNLFTALNSIRDGSNRQTQSTRHILLGAHQYNKTICDKAEEVNMDAQPVCYVQAISVNGAGRALGYYSHIPFIRNGLGWHINDQNEATLMAEMALMNNCSDNTDQLAQIKRQYQVFLKRPQPPTWFQLMVGTNSVYLFKTREGQNIRSMIAAIKNSGQGCIVTSDKTTTHDFARFALQKITAFDLHFSHDHAKLIQALSLYVEKKALFGCKSGNERTPMICERALVLDQKDLLTTEPSLTAAFKALCEASTVQGAKAAAEALGRELDRIYNIRRVYGVSTMISLVDQGAGHKIKRKDSSFKSRVDTNYAEEREITSLCQSRTKAMQAHNGLVTYMHAAWDRRKLDVTSTVVAGNVSMSVDGEMLINDSPRKMMKHGLGKDHKTVAKKGHRIVATSDPDVAIDRSSVDSRPHTPAVEEGKIAGNVEGADEGDSEVASARSSIDSQSNPGKY